MKRMIGATIAAALVLVACGRDAANTTLTIATVNNGDMVVMKKLATEFERTNPGIHLKWVVLEENVLRQRVTTDITTGAGQFDVITIGNYEVPIWARQGWLKPIRPLPPEYDVDDILPRVRAAASYNGDLYALPFYAESGMTYYRTDLFEAAGLKMPDKPTYAQIAEFAARLDNDAQQIYGICLRGKPGWGENMGLVTAIVHAYGGRWFDMNWRPALDTTEWKRAIEYYSSLLRNHGPPGAASNGFNENLVLFSSGHCAMWIDATVAASMIYGGESKVAGKMGYAPMPTADDLQAPTWLWSWDLAVPTSSRHSEAAIKFVSWATSRDYVKLVANSEGWIKAPPGTRKSTYDAPEYQRAAPFAAFVRNAIETATASHTGPATRPYDGAQFVAIPEYQGIGTRVGQNIAATLTGQTSVDEALKDAQSSTLATMQQAGYPK